MMKWFFFFGNNSENITSNSYISFLYLRVVYSKSRLGEFDTKLYQNHFHFLKKIVNFKFMVTFGDSESFLGDGPIPEEADG